jgi:phage baseplate assembly protein gpV
MMREMMITIQDLQRRMNNILRPGPIVAVDPKSNSVKVRLSEGDAARGIKAHDSAWLRVLQDRAGSSSSWDFPEIGEQVLVLSPGGELGGGYALPAIYSIARPAPSDNPDIHFRRFADGLELTYDDASHTLRIARPKDLTEPGEPSDPVDPRSPTDPGGPRSNKPALTLIFSGTAIEFNATEVAFTAEKFSIRNQKGDEVLTKISDGLKSIQNSTTVTMMGNQPLLPAKADLTPITTSIDSFGDS